MHIIQTSCQNESKLLHKTNCFKLVVKHVFFYTSLPCVRAGASHDGRLWTSTSHWHKFYLLNVSHFWTVRCFMYLMLWPFSIFSIHSWEPVSFLKEYFTTFCHLTLVASSSYYHQNHPKVNVVITTWPPSVWVLPELRLSSLSTSKKAGMQPGLVVSPSQQSVFIFDGLTMFFRYLK